MRPCALLSIALLLGVSAPARAEEWTLASISPESSEPAAFLQDFSRRIERATDGRVRIRTRLGGVIGDEQATLRMCQDGRIQIWAGSLSAAQAVVPDLAVLETPYLFDSVEDVDRALRGPMLDQPLVAKSFRDRGLVVIGGAFIGWRAMSTRSRPALEPSALRGMAARSTPVPLHRAMWRVLGALPKDLELPEVQPAYRDGAIDAIDVPVLYLFGTGVVDRLRYHVRTNHIAQIAFMVFNREAYGRLTRRQQQEILRLRTDLSTSSTRIHLALEEELLRALGQQGVQVLTPGPAEVAAWRHALAPVSGEAMRIAGPVGAELLRAVRRAR